jgi:hypothetical protein
MADLYQKERSSLSDYVKHFRPVEVQVGAVFLINGKVVGLDSFGRPETLAKVFRKLVESYALDAVDWSEPDSEERPSGAEVRRFLEAARAALGGKPLVGRPGDGLPHGIRKTRRLCPGSRGTGPSPLGIRPW